jgi:hypothetical protein
VANILSSEKKLGTSAEGSQPENLRDERRKIFEELTNITGKRIYRMRRLQWALRSGDAEKATARLNDYAAVLIEWNDNIARIFSLVEMYFGKELRDYFEKKVSLDLVHIGSALEKRYRSGDLTSPTPNTTQGIDNMSGKLENLQRRMLRIIEA